MSAIPTESPSGDDGLFARVYTELKNLARHKMDGERKDHTLQATALVSEVWMRMRDQPDESLDDPRRFFLAAAESMRRILIEHARRRHRQKRGGDMKKLTLDLAQVADSANLDQVLAIDAAIDELARASERAATLVRLRFFAGMTEAGAAEAMEMSERTARREWAFARAWLYRKLND